MSNTFRFLPVAGVEELVDFEANQPFDNGLADSAQADDANGTSADLLAQDFAKTDLPFTTEIVIIMLIILKSTT